MTNQRAVTKTGSQGELERRVYQLERRVAALEAPAAVFSPSSGLTLGATWANNSTNPFRIRAYPNGIVLLEGRLDSSGTTDAICELPRNIWPQNAANNLAGINSTDSTLALVGVTLNVNGYQLRVASAAASKTYDFSGISYQAIVRN